MENVRSEGLAALLLSTALLWYAPLSAKEGPKQGPATTPPEWKVVEQAIGKPGAMLPGEVFKISLPRSDLRVKARGVEIKPALALGSWLAFKMMKGGAMVMGDLVLTEDEVNPVMGRLQQGGIEQTALHNHVLDESPRVMYMHVGGRGDPRKLAETIHAALALSKTPLSAPAGPPEQRPLLIDTGQIDQILGQRGKVNGGVYQISIPRADKIVEDGMEIPTAMGLATALNFQPTGDGQAAITGDFVLTAGEVNPVIRALREGEIEVTALHNHMLTEEPRLFFMHFWARGDALKLARALRAAVEKTNSMKSAGR